MEKTLLFNRFRPNSVGGKIVRVLSTGQPKTVAEIARVAKPRSRDNILATGGWYDRLRAYGKASRKFNLRKTDDGKIVMVVRKRKAA